MTCNSSCLKTSEEKGKWMNKNGRKFKRQNSCQWVKLESDLLQAWPLCCQGRHRNISASGQSCLTSWLPSSRRTWHSPKGTSLTWSPSTADSRGDAWLDLSVLPLPSSWVWAPLSDIAVWWTTLQFVSQCEKCKCSWRQCVEMSDNSGLLKQLMSY